MAKEDKKWKYDINAAREQGQQRRRTNGTSKEKNTEEIKENGIGVYAKNNTSKVQTPKITYREEKAYTPAPKNTPKIDAAELPVVKNSVYGKYAESKKKGESTDDLLSSLMRKEKKVETGNKYFDNMLYSGVFDKSASGRVTRAQMQSEYFARQLKPLEEIWKNAENPSYMAEFQKKYNTDNKFRASYDNLMATYNKYIEVSPLIEENFNAAYDEYKTQITKNRVAMLGSEEGQLQLYINQMIPKLKEGYKIPGEDGTFWKVNEGKNLAQELGIDVFKNQKSSLLKTGKEDLADFFREEAFENISQEEKDLFYYTLAEYGEEQATDYANKLINSKVNAVYSEKEKILKKTMIPGVRFFQRLAIQPMASVEGIGRASEDLLYGIKDGSISLENFVEGFRESKDFTRNTPLIRGSEIDAAPNTVGKHLLYGDDGFFKDPELAPVIISNYSLTDLTNAIEDTKLNIPDKYGLSEYVNLLEESMLENKGAFGKIATQLAITMGDMAVAIWMGNALAGGSLGLSTAEAAKTAKAASKFTRGVMASQVFSGNYNEAIKNGVSTDKALLGSLLSASATYALEKVPLEKMFSGKYTDGIIKRVLKVGIPEGAEEFAEAEIDALVNKYYYADKGQWQKSVDNYIKQGLSPEEARQKANIDGFIVTPLKNFGMGFLAGGLMGEGSLQLSTFNTGAEVMSDGKSIKSFDDLTKSILGADVSDYKGKAAALQEQLQKYKTDFENSSTKLGKIMSAGKAMAVASEFNGVPKVMATHEISEGNRGFLNALSKADNINILYTEVEQEISDDGEGYRAGYFVPGTNTVVIDYRATAADIFEITAGHEVGHSIEGSKYYEAFKAKAIEDINAENEPNGKTFDDIVREKAKKYADAGEKITKSAAEAEVIADYIGRVIKDNSLAERMAKRDYGTARLIVDKAKDIYGKVESFFGADTKKGVEETIRLLERAVGMRNTNPLTSAAAVQYNISKGNYEQYGMTWTIGAGALTKNEVSAFSGKISEMKNNKYVNYKMSNEGEYIFSVGNKLIYSDADYDNPNISKVITFNTENENLIDFARECIYDYEQQGFNLQDAIEIIEIMYGEKFVTQTNSSDSETYGRKITGGERTVSGEIDIGSREDVSYSIENLTPEQVEAVRSSEEGQERGGLEYENSNTEGLGADGTYRSGDGIRAQGDDTQSLFGGLGRSEATLGIRKEEQQGKRTDDFARNLQQSISRFGESVSRNLSRLGLRETDVDDRRLTSKVKEYFKNTVTKNDEGYLVPFFHGTLSEFDVFLYGDIGFHLGTLEQAQKRIEQLKKDGKKGRERIIEAYINITNPVYLPKDRMQWDALATAHQLFERKIINEAELEEILKKKGAVLGGYDAEASKELRNILETKGYDGIMYNNRFERDGVSFIAFNQNQIKYVTNEAPTSNPNMKYSIENLSPEQVEAIKKAEESGDKVSEFYKNSLQKEVITPAVKAEDAPERHKYKPISNEETYKNARAYVEVAGFDNAKAELELKFDESIPLTSEEVGRAEYIFTRLQSEGKTSESVLFAERWNRSVTEGARALQALQILDRLTPEGKYLYAVRQAERKTEKQVSRLKGEKKKNFEKELAEAKRKDKIAEDADKKLLEEAEKGEMLVELMEPKKNGKKPREVEKVYKKYGIDYLSKADREYISDTLKTLDGLETKEDFINLILKQNHDRGRTNPWWLKKQLEKTDIAFLKDTAWHQVIRKTQDIEKSTVASKIKTARIMAMLMNMRTFNRNIVSNFAFSGMDALANNVGLIADWVMSKGTGQRSVAFDNWGFGKGGGKAMGKAAREGAIEIALDTQRGESKYGLGKKAVFKNRGMAALERGMGYMLSTTDAMSEGGIVYSTTKGLEKLRDKGLLKISDEDIAAYASEISDFRTFKDRNGVSKAIGDIKEALNKLSFKTKAGEVAFGLGDFVLPFVQVPGAIVQRSIEFSPIGYFKAIQTLTNIKKMGGLTPKMQRDIALSFGRATTGAGLTMAFSLLASLGIVTGSRDDEDTEKKAQALEGEQGLSGFQLNSSALGRVIKAAFTEETLSDAAKAKEGDTLVKYDFLEPISNNMAVGYAIAQTQGGNVIDTAALSGAKFLEQLIDTTGFDTVEKMLDKETALSERIITLAVDAGTSFVPRVISQAAQAFDTTYRNVYDEEGAKGVGIARFKSSIPGVRNTLPAKVNPFGSEVSNTTGNRVLDFFNAFVNPGTVSKYHTNDVIDEVQKVYKETGVGEILPPNITKNKDTALGNGIKADIYSYDFEKYKKEVGTMLYSAYDEAMKTEAYKKMSYSEKAEALKKLKNAAEDKAKAKFAIEEGKVKGVESIKMEIDTEKNYFGSILAFYPEDTEKHFKWGDYESASGFMSYLKKQGALTAEGAKKINEYTKNKEYKSSVAKDAILKSAANEGSNAPFKVNYDSLFEWSNEGIEYRLQIKPEKVVGVMQLVDAYTDAMLESLYKDGYYTLKRGMGTVKNADGNEVYATWENMSDKQRVQKVSAYKSRVIDSIRAALATQKNYKIERVKE